MEIDASWLLSVTAATPETYTYDLLGNRTGQHDIEGAWQYNELNELLGYADVSYEYDDNGNLTHIKRDDEVVWTYIYDAANRMIHAEDATGSITADYLYDPFGRRLRKEVDKNGIVTTTYFLYADEGLIGEFSESGTPLRVYGYLPGTSTPLFLKQNDTYYWYRTDRLGMPHTLVASNGTVVWSGTYDAYGNCVVDAVSTVVSNLRLPGQYYDEETGLYYNLNRYYDPKTGRYLQPDPAGDGLNPYTYVDGNPVNAIDPEGLCAFRMFSGMTETLVGYGFVKSGVFLVSGTLMMINGMDEAVAGFRGLWTGQPSRSVLEHAMYSTIPNETVASSVHFASQLAISAGPGIAELIGDVGRYSRRMLADETGIFRFGRGKNVERFKRYGNQVEAELSEATNRLHLRPGHETQPKWISHEDAVTGTRFGKPKNYTHKMNIETVAGTRNWLGQFEIKSSIEPGRYAIPASRLDEFNRRILQITLEKVR